MQQIKAGMLEIGDHIQVKASSNMYVIEWKSGGKVGGPVSTTPWRSLDAAEQICLNDTDPVFKLTPKEVDDRRARLSGPEFAG